MARSRGAAGAVFAARTARAIGRAMLAEEAQEAPLRAESERLRGALGAGSHEKAPEARLDAG